MKIKVKTMSGKDLEVDLEPEHTIIHLKRKIEEAELISPEQQRLVCNGKILLNDKATFSSLNIQNGNVIHMVLALRGG